MSVRIIILLLALPLFLLLAAINSVLLYREDTRDMEAGLRNEALSAAVTIAEFARASADPVADLSEPRRLAALHSVNREITGLDALYLVRPGEPPLNLLDKAIVEPRRTPAPAKAEVIGTREDVKGRHMITALAPAGRGTMVVADIDAEPLARRAAYLKRLSIELVGGSAALALVLGLIVARRVRGEFRRARAIIDARGGPRAEQPLAIREVRDLADAVHLIDANVTSELQRLGGNREGDPAIGIAAAQARHFPDLSVEHGGIELSIRLVANAPAGIFYAHALEEDGVMIAVGQVRGDSAAALASAVAVKGYLAAGPSGEFMQRVALAAPVFGARIASSGLYAGTGGFVSLSLHDNAQAMRDYAARNPNLDPDSLTADLAALFPDAGIIAAARERTRDTIEP